MNFYKDKKIVVTGGCGFIGSHLVEKLVELGSNVTVIDNLFKGNNNNLKSVSNKIQIYNLDLNNPRVAIDILIEKDIVFHLANVIGGRGFIEDYPGDCCQAFSINENVFRACLLNKVERLHFASTACVYPNHLQDEYGSKYLLKEEDALLTNASNMDTIYGWAKLTGELQLKAYYEQYGLKSSIARYVTAYGPREDSTHAIIALLNRAVNREDPYTIWGTGRQDRDFTYVSDIVNGSLLLTEKITDATPINLGTGVKYTINKVKDMIFKTCNWKPETIFYDESRPEGVKSRGLDITKSISLGWKPKISLEEGIKLTYKELKK